MFDCLMSGDYDVCRSCCWAIIVYDDYDVCLTIVSADYDVPYDYRVHRLCVATIVYDDYDVRLTIVSAEDNG